MGNSYQFAAAKKDAIPANQEYDDETGWTLIGCEMDREDWISRIFAEAQVSINEETRYSKQTVETVIAMLEQLDRDVNTILNDERYDIGFRRKLAKGLVMNVYGYREYHYNYPKRYYAEDSYQIQHWTDENWECHEKQSGSKYIQDNLKLLLPYCNGEYDIKMFIW